MYQPPLVRVSWYTKVTLTVPEYPGIVLVSAPPCQNTKVTMTVPGYHRIVPVSTPPLSECLGTPKVSLTVLGLSWDGPSSCTYMYVYLYCTFPMFEYINNKERKRMPWKILPCKYIQCIHTYIHNYVHVCKYKYVLHINYAFQPQKFVNPLDWCLEPQDSRI